MSAQKWTRHSLRQLSRRLADAGYRVSHQTVGRLLKALKYSLRVNAKRVEARSHHPDRPAQFDHITAQRQAFQAAGQPIISVDAKKKELIGNFKQAGRAWGRVAEAVNVHDFRSEGLGRAVPYGIYDVTANCGTVAVGESGDTPAFAVAAIARWWEGPGRLAYPEADRLLILADGGGSNGYRPRVWKQQVQEQLGDRLGLTVTICHYPPGCSKWNPIEHRLFGPISLNWAGIPLRTWETLVGAIGATTTTTGLRVEAERLAGTYPTGVTVSDAEMAALALDHDPVCPSWNYTIRPRPATGDTPMPTEPGDREVIL